MIIGPSTSYLYANDISSTQDHARILRESGANCFEINLGLPERIKFLQDSEEFGDFSYRAGSPP